MKIQRIIPPTAVPIKLRDLLHGAVGMLLSEKYIKKLESEVKEYFGVEHVFFVSSGKAALTLILIALKDISNKNQVVIPAYTCFSVPSAIVKADLKITLCDIDSVTLDFDYDHLEKVVTGNTLCVIPHHLFGIPADMDRIKKLCRHRGIFIIEDAVQAMGGQYKGRKIGTIGDVGFFSFSRGKQISCGSGGVIVTNSGSIAEAIAKHYANLEEPSITEVLKEFLQFVLMSIFIHPELYWFPTGMPFLKLGQTIFHKDFPLKNLSKRKAGLLRHWQDRLVQSNQTRTKTAVYFSEQLRLKKVQETSVPYLRFPVLVNSQQVRDRIYALSQKRGLGVSCMYPTPINEIEEIRYMFNNKSFPLAKYTAERLLTIPTHYLLSEKDKEAICELFDKTILLELTPTFQED